MLSVDNLEQARKLTEADPAMLGQVLPMVFQIGSNASELAVQRWIAAFVAALFAPALALPDRLRQDMSLKAVPCLDALARVRDVKVFVDTVRAMTHVYEAVFRYVADNPGPATEWIAVLTTKRYMLDQFRTAFPYESDNEEHDWYRALPAKLQLVKFMLKVVVVQTRGDVRNEAGVYGMHRVPRNHPSINQATEAEGVAVLDEMLAMWHQPLTNAAVATGVINALPFILRNRPGVAGRVFEAVQRWENTPKQQLNYELVALFKMQQRFVERTMKVFLRYCFQAQLVPHPQDAQLAPLMLLLQNRERGRRENPLAPLPDDANIKKRKHMGFFNSSTTAAGRLLKDIWLLGDPEDQTHLFDIANIDQATLTRMILIGLERTPPARVAKALEIVYQRVKNMAAEMDSGANEGPEDQELDGEQFDPDQPFVLPPPEAMDEGEKREHLRRVISKCMEVAGTEGSAAVQVQATDGTSSELSRTALQRWDKTSWLVVLLRLASRGVAKTWDEQRPADSEGEGVESYLDMIRTAIFNHYTESVGARVEVAMEWLSEEWYAERINNEAQEIARRQADSDELPEAIAAAVRAGEVPTPVYDMWCAKAVDAMILYMEASDRKPFLRMLGDLPRLTRDMVQQLRRVCVDPEKGSVGFQALRFLAMFKPPVRDYCIELLNQLSEQEDVGQTAKEVLAKLV